MRPSICPVSAAYVSYKNLIYVELIILISQINDKLLHAY